MSSAGAQSARVQPEVRLDALTGRDPAVYAGAGLAARAGAYARVGGGVGIGTSEGRASVKLDLLARFHVDPYAQTRWSGYAAGGVMVRRDRDTSADVVLLAGIEGPAAGRWRPSLEAGFSGGFRVAAVLRRMLPPL